MPMSPDGLFPAVGMHSLGEEVRLHLNAELGREDDSVMMVDSYEDEWGRLHDVRVCGTVSKGQWGWAGGLGRTPVGHISTSELLRIGGEDSVFCKVLENGNFGRIAWGNLDMIFLICFLPSTDSLSSHPLHLRALLSEQVVVLLCLLWFL